MSVKTFMTSFHDNAEVAMRLTFETGKIDILLLPKQDERSEKKRTIPFVLSAAAEAARPRSRHARLHWKGKVFLLLELWYLTLNHVPAFGRTGTF